MGRVTNRNVIVLIFVGIFFVFAQENNDNTDEKTKNFLENIKQMMQSYIKNRGLITKRKGRIDKKKTKKKIINNLANPIVRMMQIKHTKMRRGKDNNRTLTVEGDRLASYRAPEHISRKAITRALKVMPVLNPFSISDLYKVLRRAKNKKQQEVGDKESTCPSCDTPEAVATHYYYAELLRLRAEVYSKIQLFWNMVYRLFILDEKRFNYLRDAICEGEISSNTRWERKSPVFGCKFYSLPQRFKCVRLATLSCDSLNPDSWWIDGMSPGFITTCVEDLSIRDAIFAYGRCTPLLYKKALLVGNVGSTEILGTGGISPHYSINKSLCYNLVALTFFADKKRITYLHRDIKPSISYLKFINKIYTGKILPILGDMCYVEGLCSDIIGMERFSQDDQQFSFSEEEKVTFLLWNLLKNDVYLPIIRSLVKLTIFKNDLGKGRVAICDKMRREFEVLIESLVSKGEKVIEIGEKIDKMGKPTEVNISLYKELLKLINNMKDESIPIREALIRLWQSHIDSAASIDDLKCVIGSFDIFLNNITVDNKNILELSLNALIGLLGEKMRERIINSINQITTLEEIQTAREVMMVLENNNYDFTNLEKSENIKVKGLIKFVGLIQPVKSSIPFQLYYDTRGDVSLIALFNWLVTLDYSAYLLTTAYNSLRCIVTTITPQMFINYLKDIKKIPEMDVSFLGCFMEGGTLQKCKESYGVIENVLGKKIGIGNLYEVKEGLDNLQKFEKWKDIPAISGCCNGDCANVKGTIKEWCGALTSPAFKECCKPPLEMCTPSSETFCLESEIGDCTTFFHSIARNGSRCYEIASPLVNMLAINYFSNKQERKIFCEVREKYALFCGNPVTFLNNIKDDDNQNPVEQWNGPLKCECGICGRVEPANSTCPAKISTSLTLGVIVRNKIEEFLKKIGLLNEAKKAIKEGLLSKNLGQCPFH